MAKKPVTKTVEPVVKSDPLAVKFEAIGEAIEALAQYHGSAKEMARKLREVLKG
jgi:hypothetical protein